MQSLRIDDETDLVSFTDTRNQLLEVYAARGIKFDQDCPLH
jgi:hypothetical protein